MKTYIMISTVVMPMILCGCDNAKTVLGFDRNANDEFSVLMTPPELSLPANFEHLPDPVASTDGSRDEGNEKKAKQATLGQFSTSVAHQEKSQQSAGEKELLQKAKVSDKDQDVRKVIDKDASADKNKSFIKDLLNIKDEGEVNALDPIEEKKRLEQENS